MIKFLEKKCFDLRIESFVECFFWDKEFESAGGVRFLDLFDFFCFG